MALEETIATTLSVMQGQTLAGYQRGDGRTFVPWLVQFVLLSGKHNVSLDGSHRFFSLTACKQYYVVRLLLSNIHLAVQSSNHAFLAASYLIFH